MDTDVKIDKQIDAVLACPDEAGRHAICAALLGALAPDELERWAEQAKLQHFDRLLHDDLRRALCLAEFLYQLGEVARRPRITALGLLALGDARRQDGRAADAMALFGQAADAFLQAGDRVGWARARGGWLIAATWAGRITLRDLVGIRAACDALREAGHLYRLAMVEQNRAVAYQTLARFPQALAAYARALAILDALDAGTPTADASGPIDRALLRGMLLGNMATTLVWHGDVKRARELRVQARTLFAGLGRPGSVALEDMVLAQIEGLGWHVRESLRLMDAAVAGLRSANQQPMLATALTLRAETLLALNRAEEALADIAEAVAIVRERQMPIDLADALCIEAVAAFRCGDGPGALDRLREAEELMGQAGSHRTMYPIGIQRAELLLALGHAAEAKALVADVAKTQTARAVAPHRHRALLVTAEAALALGQLDEAAARARALLRLKRLDAPDVVYRAHAVLARSAHRGGDVSAALAHYDAVVATLRAPAAELAYDQRAQFLEDKDALYLEALDVALEAGDPLSALTYLEQGRTRAIWTAGATGDEELDALRARHRYISGSLITLPANSPMLPAVTQELRRLERRVRDIVEARAERIAVLVPPDPAALLRALPERTTTLAYALVQGDLIIFVIARGQVTAERVTGGARQVRSLERIVRLHMDALPDWLAGCALTELSAELARREVSVQKALRALWTLLMAPVADRLPPDGESLALVPHGLLHTLPLLAMYDGERYAIERWPMACAASCRALSRDTVDLAIPGGPLLAFGYSRGCSLPHAPEEARQVAALVGGEALVDAEATGERLRREAAGHGYLHLAAHAALRLESPNSSFVELADGPFHPSDALTLDLRGCRLVTLSACRTGLGRQSGGDEQIGLLRAFGLAGAEAVLATLWRVDDGATFAFMRQLYQGISCGAQPAEALRVAQLSFIRGTDEPPRRHPYFWAGFQLMQYRAHTDEPARVATGQRRAVGVSESRPA